MLLHTRIHRFPMRRLLPRCLLLPLLLQLAYDDDVCRLLHSHRHLLPLLMGSIFQISRLRMARYCASSPDNPFSVESSLILSVLLSISLAFHLFLGASITITLLTTYYPSSLLITCTYHFSLLSYKIHAYCVNGHCLFVVV